ncbi:hypothetical protein BU14_2668s0001, partial [Porphyra umbilicalis]
PHAAAAAAVAAAAAPSPVGHRPRRRRRGLAPIPDERLRLAHLPPPAAAAARPVTHGTHAAAAEGATLPTRTVRAGAARGAEDGGRPAAPPPLLPGARRRGARARGGGAVAGGVTRGAGAGPRPPRPRPPRVVEAEDGRDERRRRPVGRNDARPRGGEGGEPRGDHVPVGRHRRRPQRAVVGGRERADRPRQRRVNDALRRRRQDRLVPIEAARRRPRGRVGGPQRGAEGAPPGRVVPPRAVIVGPHPRRQRGGEDGQHHPLAGGGERADADGPVRPRDEVGAERRERRRERPRPHLVGGAVVPVAAEFDDDDLGRVGGDKGDHVCHDRRQGHEVKAVRRPHLPVAVAEAQVEEADAGAQLRADAVALRQRPPAADREEDRLGNVRHGVPAARVRAPREGAEGVRRRQGGGRIRRRVVRAGDGERGQGGLGIRPHPRGGRGGGARRGGRRRRHRRGGGGERGGGGHHR